MFHNILKHSFKHSPKHNFKRNALKTSFITLLCSLAFFSTNLYADESTIEIQAVEADEIKTIEADDETEIDVRVFEADGDKLLLGFACDQGSSMAEEQTAQSLAMDGIEVWMPDMLSAYMLPKLRSSLHEIPTCLLYTSPSPRD